MLIQHILLMMQYGMCSHWAKQNLHFYTTGTTDTYLTIYDAKYNQYAYDDDSGPGETL